ncbi:MAG: hypothetical protein ACK5JH_02065 [Anaerocolumna sp.]
MFKKPGKPQNPENPQKPEKPQKPDKGIPCDKGCTNKACKPANVYIPVAVKAIAETEFPKTKCIGDPIIIPGKKIRKDKPYSDTCYFTIKQKVLIEIPFKVAIIAKNEKPAIDCDCQPQKGGEQFQVDVYDETKE